MNGYKHRKWATPLAIGSFVISAVTGILIFFHLNIGWVKTAHTWFSWLFVIGAVVHTIANWKPMMQYLHKPIARAIIAACLILTLTTFLPLGGSKGGNPFMAMAHTLSDMPVTEIAKIVKQSPDDLITDLRGRNVIVTEGNQTITEIAKLNHKKDLDVLVMIFSANKNNP